MAPNNTQKYIDYSITALNSLRRANGLTITDIVRHIKLTTEETQRFRKLFAKVRAATNHGISTGLLKRHRFRIQLRSDDDAMSSRDGSDTSDGDSGSEDDDGSSVGTTDNEAGSPSDDCERKGRRKTAPARGVDKKQPNPRHLSTRVRGKGKRRLVDASSDEETDSDEGHSKNKRRKVQGKSRGNETSAKRALPPKSKSSSAAKPIASGVCSKVSDGLVFPEMAKVKVEVEDSSTRKQVGETSTLALGAGKVGNTSGKRGGSEEARERGSGLGGEGSSAHRRIKEEVDEDRKPEPGGSGIGGERKWMQEVKEEEGEGNESQDGNGNEAGVSTVKVKGEKVDELKMKKEYDFYT